MNPENDESMIAYRMRQSLDTLADARFLLDNNRSSWSIINRSYYGMFYAALALLQTIGEITSKHSGVISLFDLHFYKKGFFQRSILAISTTSSFSVRKTIVGLLPPYRRSRREWLLPRRRILWRRSNNFCGQTAFCINSRSFNIIRMIHWKENRV
jgi:uncharacterized protein (UPF0332 family)